MVLLGMANSRMKDFFDVDFLARHFRFDGAVLASAIDATFARRRTEVPATLPTAFTTEFAADASKQVQWRAFLRKANIPNELELPGVVEHITRFAWPAFEGACTGSSPGLWSFETGWCEPTQR
jgi:hypothetical protein